MSMIADFSVDAKLDTISLSGIMVKGGTQMQLKFTETVVLGPGISPGSMTLEEMLAAAGFSPLSTLVGQIVEIDFPACDIASTSAVPWEPLLVEITEVSEVTLEGRVHYVTFGDGDNDIFTLSVGRDGDPEWIFEMDGQELPCEVKLSA